MIFATLILATIFAKWTRGGSVVSCLTGACEDVTDWIDDYLTPELIWGPADLRSTYPASYHGILGYDIDDEGEPVPGDDYDIDDDLRVEMGFHGWHQIRCIGPTPSDLNLSYVFGQNYSQHLTMHYPNPRSLCAKRRYGGNPQWNSGGYCNDIENEVPVDAQDPQRIIFEHDGRRRLPDVKLFCLLRCRCLNTTEGPEIAQARIEGSESRTPDPYDANKIRSYGTELLATYGVDRPPTTSSEHITAIAILEGRETIAAQYRPKLFGVVPYPKWRAPWCRRRGIPNWIRSYLKSAAPATSTESKFWENSLIEDICLPVFYTRAPINAGFICVGPDSMGNKHLEYREWLAHPSTLPSQLPYGLAIHILCRTSCWCRGELDPKARNRAAIPYWPDQRAIGTYDPNEGAVSFIIPNKRDPTLRFTVVNLGRDSGGSADAGSFVGPCGEFKVGNCKGKWPTEIIPYPGRSPELSVTIKEKLVKTGELRSQSPSKCGVKCNKYSDCAATKDDPCRCVFNPTKGQLNAAGYQYWASKLTAVDALCVPLITLGLRGGVAAVAKPGRLGGRAVESNESQPPTCRCNETAIGPACCSSGLVDAGDGGVFLV